MDPKAAKATKKQVSPQKSFELPLFILWSIKILQKIAPPLALRFALKLFFTPLKFKIPERERSKHELAKRSNRSLTSGSNYEAFEWGDSTNETIILVHGWSGRATQFFALIDALLISNYHIVSFNAPAHGQSKEKKTSLLEFTECIEDLNQEFGPIHKGIGHSLGGGALFIALSRGLALHQIISLGSPSSIKEVISDFCEKAHANKKIKEGINAHIELMFSIKTDEISNDYLARKFKPKGMVIHDKEDVDVPIRHAHSLHSAWPESEIIISKGNGHRRILNDKAIIEKIMAFIKS